MIKGKVTENLIPMVSIDVRNEAGSYQTLTFTVDTGFNGELTLPPAVIRRLGIPHEEQTLVILADGSQIRPIIYRGITLWHGRRRVTRIIELDDAPLLGMSMLSDSTLMIRARPDSDVLIVEANQETN